MGWRLETDASLKGEPQTDKGIPRQKVDAQLKAAKRAARTLLKDFDDDARVTLSGYVSTKKDPAPAMVAAIVHEPSEGFIG